MGIVKDNLPPILISLSHHNIFTENFMLVLWRASDYIKVITISLVRYYDMDKGDCFKCSRCCGDDRDVVVKECKEKLGDGSNMVCSFDSSVNRCGQTMPQPTTIISHVDPKHDGPYNTQKSDHSTKANDRTTTVILVVIIVVLVFCVCSCVFKKKLAQMLSWCYRTVEEEDHHDLSVMEDGSSTDGKGGKTV